MSDIARVWPSGGAAQILIAGTAASNTAGAGVVQPAGAELAALTNQHKGRNYGDLAK